MTTELTPRQQQAKEEYDRVKVFAQFAMMISGGWFLLMCLLIVLYAFFDITWWAKIEDGSLKGMFVFFVNIALTVIPGAIFLAAVDFIRDAKAAIEKVMYR